VLNEAIIAAGGAAIGVVLSKLIDFWKVKSAAKVEEQRAESELHTAETEKAAEIMRDIISDLRVSIGEQAKHIKELDDDRLSCREEKATLRAENKSLRDEVARLAARVG
jgi:septal ring factor EnvC (AmiA/AmiB activator)